MFAHRVAFRHPCGIAPPPRTALLAPGFKRSLNVRTFLPALANDRWLEKVEQFAPQSLAASPHQLLYLAKHQNEYRERLRSLRHSLILMFRTEQPWVHPKDRDSLWDAFGLPMYEQIYGVAGLIATECEAHDGLHAAKGAEWTTGQFGELWYREPASWWEDRGESFAPSGLFGTVDVSPCPCGRRTPRLKVQSVPKALAEVA